MDVTEWNWVSMQFDREMGDRSKDKTGKQLVPLFIDHILQDSCSSDVRHAFEQALRKYFATEKRR